MATNTESLRTVSKALETYMEEVNHNIDKMRDAAIDCHDNMDHDDVSEEAIKNFENCANELKKSMNKAEELKHDIDELIKRIEND